MAGVDAGGLAAPVGDPAGGVLTVRSPVVGRIRAMPIATTAITTSPTATGRLLPRLASVSGEGWGGSIAGRHYRFRPIWV